MDQGDVRLEKRMVSNLSDLIPLPVAEGCVSGPIIDCNSQPTSSTQLIVLDLNSRIENTAEPGVQQELLQTSDDLNSLLVEAGHSETSDMTTSRDEGKQNDVVFNKELDRRLEALGEDEEDRHEVERIIAHDEYNGWKRYHVKWVGWPTEHMTWEPEGNLDDCSEIVKEYWASMGNPDTISNTPGTRSGPIPPSDRVGDDRASLLDPMAKILDQLKEVVPSLQTLLATQLVQSEASDTSISGNTARKRKIPQEFEDLSDEDEEDAIAYLDAGIGIEKSKSESKKPMIARKRHRNRCGRCKAKGHNSRTCPNKAVDRKRLASASKLFK